MPAEKVTFIFATQPLPKSEISEILARIKKCLRRRNVSIVSAVPSKDSGIKLTPRQTETLRWMAHGLSTSEIAFKLGLSEKTVETHRKHLMERVGVNRIPELLRFAIQAGMVPVSWLLG